jgi:hypothetical protein
MNHLAGSELSARENPGRTRVKANSSEVQFFSRARRHTQGSALGEGVLKNNDLLNYLYPSGGAPPLPPAITKS